MKNIISSAVLMFNSSMALASHFHIALPVTSPKGIREFYGELLGAQIEHTEVGKTETFAINLDGHSIVMRIYPKFRYQRRWTENIELGGKKYYNVDGFHFGPLVSKERWLQLRDKVLLLQKQGQNLIEIAPYLKNEGKENEVGFMILKAPSGYSFEVKYAADIHTGVQDAPRKELHNGNN